MDRDKWPPVSIEPRATKKPKSKDGKQPNTIAAPFDFQVLSAVRRISATAARACTARHCFFSLCSLGFLSASVVSFSP